MVRHTAVAVKKSPTSLPIRRNMAKVDQDMLKIRNIFEVGIMQNYCSRLQESKHGDRNENSKSVLMF